jgi:Fuc2NAc and GlcNAc transferase
MGFISFNRISCRAWGITKVIHPIIVFLTSFAVAFLATKFLIPVLKKKKIIDKPNDRSSHQVPTPRGGGAGLVGGFVCGVAVAAWFGALSGHFAFFIALGLIVLAGCKEDFFGGFPVFWRLLFQFVAAGIIVWKYGSLTSMPLPAPCNFPFGLLGVAMSLLWIVGVVNLYNFLDGIDGFAAMQGIVGGGMICFFAHDPFLFVIGLSLAGACLAFLVFNWYPAKVFMGDMGSTSLGFIFASVPFMVSEYPVHDVMFVMVIVLWFFLSDGIFTVLRRLRYKENILAPHRKHLYQILVRTGLRHDQVVLSISVATLGLAVFAYAATSMGNPVLQWAVILLAGVSFLIYYKITLGRAKRLRYLGKNWDEI